MKSAGLGLKFGIKEIPYYLMAVIGLVHILMLRFVPTAPQIKAILFLLYTLVFIFITKKSKLWFIDAILIILSIVPLVYLLVNYNMLVTRASPPVEIEWFMAIAIMIPLLEATRRTVGWPLVIIALIFLLYGFLGRFMPGLLWHRGFSLARFAQNMYIITSGIFSSATQIAATIIVAFVIMGELMVNLGASEFFTRAAEKVTGNLTAGNSKMAVLAGLLFGMINGSAAANVVTTGKITIPLMRNDGYTAENAGAIASAAATGGPLSPPVMGAAAFLIAEYCGISYGEVCLKSIATASLYYFALLLFVHFEARRIGVIKPARAEALPEYMEDGKKRPPLLIQYFHIFIPLVLLVVLIVLAYPILFGCIISMALMLVMGIINPYCKVTVKVILDSLSNGFKGSLGVTAACASSGIIVCVIGTTGFGLTFTSFILREGVTLIFALIMTMIIVIILGMGLPGVAAYIVGISVAVSVLRKFDIPTVHAHLFIYFFSCMAVITPPVALTAYAAAGLSGGNPMKTGWKAVLITLPSFILPFVFIFDPALLFEGNILNIIYRLFVTSVGVFGLSIAITGYFKCNINIINRLILFIGGLCAIIPHFIADIVGIGLVTVVIIMNILLFKKNSRLPVSAG